MINTSQAPSSATQPDPTLATLIPRRSTRRNLLLAVAAAALLVGAWASPNVLRPSITGNATAMESMPFAPAHQVLVTVELTPQGWPNVGVQSVGDLGGAKVAGAWVLHGATAMPADVDPAKFANGLDYLRAAWPQTRFETTGNLPQTVEPGKPAQLVILWQITDCSGLVEGQSAQVELKSAWRTNTRQLLSDMAAPGYEVNTLTESGTCPKR